MLVQNLLSAFTLILSTGATVIPAGKKLDGSNDLSHEQQIALDWALDLIGHEVGVYRDVAGKLFLLHYGHAIPRLFSRQTLLFDGAGQLISALSPVIADSLRKPCIPLPPTVKAEKALELTGVNVEDLPRLPKAQAQECEEKGNSAKGTEVLSDLLGKLPLVNN